MKLRGLLDDLHRLGNVDGALDEEIDLETVLDYCAVAGLEGSSEAYLRMLGESMSAERSICEAFLRLP